MNPGAEADGAHPTLRAKGRTYAKEGYIEVLYRSKLAVRNMNVAFSDAVINRRVGA
jgi:hypothetical protein